MIEGIKYYPKKKKRNRSKLSILLVLTVVLIFYGAWFFYQKFEPNTSKSTIIVIEPKIIEEALEVSPETNKEPLDSQKNEINEKGLDEVVENYEASTYNQ